MRRTLQTEVLAYCKGCSNSSKGLRCRQTVPVKTSYLIKLSGCSRADHHRDALTRLLGGGGVALFKQQDDHISSKFL